MSTINMLYDYADLDLDEIEKLYNSNKLSAEIILTIGCKFGQMNLVIFAICKGAKNFNQGLVYACSYFNINKICGKKLQDSQEGKQKAKTEIVKYLIKKGANCANWALKVTTKSNILDMVNIIFTLNPTNYEQCFLNACKYNNIDIVKCLYEYGARNLNEAFVKKCSRCNVKDDNEIIKFLIEKGADDWDQAYYKAVKTGNQSIINMLQKKDAKCYFID